MVRRTFKFCSSECSSRDIVTIAARVIMVFAVSYSLRRDDPNSGAASFSVTLGPAPHLDMHYTVFGCVLLCLKPASPPSAD